MILVSSDLRVLFTLIKAQSSVANYVYVDSENMRAYHMARLEHSCQEEALESNRYLVFNCKPEELEDSLVYLQECGLIARKAFGCIYQVTRIGWRNKAARDREVIDAILTHFAFPSLVALVTTLLTLFIAA